MKIDPGAQAIYQKYMSRATDAGRSIGRFTRKYLDAIFASAAGPNKALSKEESKAVEKFFKDSGKDLKHISDNEAKNLAIQWQSKAAKHYLSSITKYNDIVKGFDKLHDNLCEVAPQGHSLHNLIMGGKVDINAFNIKVAVFYNRIIKGKNALTPKTVAMIRTKIDNLMSTPEARTKACEKVKVTLGEFCGILLRMTAENDAKGRSVYNDYVDKHFPNGPFRKAI